MTDEKKAPYIDPSAHVSERAKIGAGTKIWINAQIREDAEIGENCVIGKDVYIDHAVKIGNGVKIQNGVSVFNGVTIEDDVFVGPNAVFTNDYYRAALFRIGRSPKRLSGAARRSERMRRLSAAIRWENIAWSAPDPSSPPTFPRIRSSLATPPVRSEKSAAADGVFLTTHPARPAAST